ncbi:MAG TPA: O-antigen ligase family protein [Puia sp.]|nr:O-antigen ligase family protein [Puia sp.]
MKFLFLIAVAIGFIYALIRKPEIIAVVLFTFIIARINFDLQGLPLNTRAILSLALFGRILMDRTTNIKFSTFLGNGNVKILVVFLIYVIFVSMSQDLFTLDLLKELISSVLAAYFVFYFFLKNLNANHLKTAIIISGFICFADLAYTYIAFGSFPIHRIYEQFTGEDNASYDDILAGVNWNFFGQICGMGFVYIFCDLVKNRSGNRYIAWLLPIMLLGVMMSTSRSAIVGMLVVTILIILNGINYNDQKRRMAKIGTFFIGSAIIGMLLFATLGKYVNLDSKFLDEVISRLADEPVAILKRAMGQPYNIQSLGSMDWREESSENAYSAFLNLNLSEQLFGIGYGGFEARSLGHGYNAHNATLLLLIENGIIGFFIYFLLVAGVIVQSIIKKNYSPSLAVIIFILVFGLGQNREWTSVTTYLFVVCVIAELKVLSLNRNNSNLLNNLTPRQPVIHS